MITKKIFEKTKFPFYFFLIKRGNLYSLQGSLSFLFSLPYHSTATILFSVLFSRLRCFLLTNNTDPNGFAIMVIVSQFRC